MKIHGPIILGILLSACGGNGGGGGSGSDNDDNDHQGPVTTLSVSDNSIDIIAHIDDGNIALEFLEAVVTNIQRELRLDLASNGVTLADVRIAQTSNGSNVNLHLELEMLPPELLGLGNHSDFLQIYICSDQENCVNGSGQIAGSPFTVNINYTVTGDPTVHHVAPYVGKPGVTREVSIRGVGFSLLESPAVKFGIADALSMQVINDTEIKASYPALAAGEYTVSVLNNGSPIVSETRLVLVDEPDFPYTFIPRDSIKTKIVYDAQRQALLVLTPHTDTIERYAYSSGTWDITVSGTINDIQDFEPTPDGRYLLVTSTYLHQDNDGIQLFDPVTLQHIRMATYPSWIDPSQHFRDIGIANNGRALLDPTGGIGIESYLFNYRTDMFLGLRADNNALVFGTSGDGRYVIAQNIAGSTQAGPDLIYDSRTGQILSENIFEDGDSGIGVRGMAVDYNGDTLAIDEAGNVHVYQSSVKTGTVMPFLDGSHIERYGFGLSADGSRLYLVDRISDDTNSLDKLSIFDLNSPDGTGGFEQITGSPLSIPNQLGGDRIAPLIAVSPEQKTLFIAAEFGVLIYPIPD